MLKTLLITTSLAAGLTLLDVAQPVLTGGIAEAAPPRRVVAARAKPAARVNVAKRNTNFARPRSNFSKPKAAFRFKPAPKIVHSKPTPKFVKPTKQIKINPQVLKGTPTVNPQALKGSVNPALGKPGPHLGLKNGPGFGKVALGPATGLKPGTFIKV